MHNSANYSPSFVVQSPSKLLPPLTAAQTRQLTPLHFHPLQDSLSLRSVIATSAGLTVMYTPLLKRMTAIKNIVVAAIVAASPLAGALAAGAVRATADEKQILLSCQGRYSQQQR